MLTQKWTKTLAILAVSAFVVAALGCASYAAKLDYTTHKVTVVDPDWVGGWATGLTDNLVDCFGTEPYPVASALWSRDDAPAAGKPAVVIMDYGTPVKVAALVNYFYVPGSRDHRWGDFCSGPSAFNEVKIYTSDDKTAWKEVTSLKDLPIGCPQVLKVASPTSARYLKLEVISMAKGSGRLRTYELDTYTDELPTTLPTGTTGKAEKRTWTNKAAIKPANSGTCAQTVKGQIAYDLAVPGGASRATGLLEVTVDGAPVVWTNISTGNKLSATAKAAGGNLAMNGQFVKTGLLLSFKWDGQVTYPKHKIDVIAKPNGKLTEWCVPEYYYSNAKAPEKVEKPSASVQTCVSIVGDNKTTLSFIPESDQSWVGVLADGLYTSFPLDNDEFSAILVASNGGWFSGFERTVADVFDFNEPRQFSPVMTALEKHFRLITRPGMWSEKYQMLRSFPDTDFFYIFYSLPYAIPALTYWQEMTGDQVLKDKIDKILKFTLNQRVRTGPMKGAIYSEYTDRKLMETGMVPFGYAPYYAWYTKYPDELIGMDQGSSHWITSHNMGAVLWAVTTVWQFRGELPQDLMEGAKDVADWMVSHMKDDGCWSYAYLEDGSIISPMSDSGTIWNIWSLYRFGKLTGDKKYSDAAAKAVEYFKNTFVKNHMYRGYWEDNYGGGTTVLNEAQGYEASLASMAFAEMGDTDSMMITARDGLRYVCTRTLESRDYWTSYGGASEQQGWAPATYIAPTFGRAAHVASLRTGDKFLARFGSIAKTVGWWMDVTDASFWIGEAVGQNPIEQWKAQGGQRSYWALWDSAQKSSMALQWLVDEVNRRTGKAFNISTENLKGTDENGKAAVVKYFSGQVDSTSGQVNWMWFDTADKDLNRGHDLVLINHAETTQVVVKAPSRTAPVSLKLYGPDFKARAAKWSGTASEIKLEIPAGQTAVFSWNNM